MVLTKSLFEHSNLLGWFYLLFLFYESKVSCTSKNNTMSRPGLDRRPLDLEIHVGTLTKGDGTHNLFFLYCHDS